MKVLLVEESTAEALPAHLEKILRSVTSRLGNDVTESDLTVAVLFVLMMEVGFTPVDPKNRDKGPFYGNEFNLRRLQSAELPSSWRRDAGSTYDLHFLLDPLFDIPCSLLVISTDHHHVDNLIINLLVPGLESRGRCLCLHPSRYVQKSRTEFRNLRELSITFKDAVAHPVRSEILQTHALLNPSLLGLPWELQLQICTLLSVRDLGALARTNRELRVIATDQNLWRKLVERDFGTDALLRDPGEEREVNWKNEYRNRYTVQLRLWREREQQRRSHLRALDLDDEDALYFVDSVEEFLLRHRLSEDDVDENPHDHNQNLGHTRAEGRYPKR